MQETCATCGAPFQPDGLRGTEYVCPFCGKTHPISPEAEKALRQQRDLEQARSFLRQRRFADAGALYQALSLSLPEEAEVWEGLLLSRHNAAAAEELGESAGWFSDQDQNILQSIEKLDAARGARLRQMVQASRQRVSKKLQTIGFRATIVLVLAELCFVLIYYALPQLFTDIASRRIYAGRFDQAYRFSSLVIRGERIFDPDSVDRAYQEADHALKGASRNRLVFGANTELFCWIDDQKAVHAVSAFGSWKNLFPGSRAVRVAVIGKMVYALSDDNLLLCRKPGQPEKTITAIAVTAFAANTCGNEAAWITAGGQLCAPQPYQRTVQVPDESTFWSRLTGKTEEVERWFWPEQEITIEPKSIAVGSNCLITVGDQAVQLVRNHPAAGSPSVLTLDPAPGLRAFCACDSAVFALHGDGSVFRSPDSGSCYTDDIADAVDIAADGQYSAVLTQQGKVRTTSHFEDTILCRDCANQEIALLLSPFTGSAYLLIR